MTNETERLQILEMIEKGVISATEGIRLINSLLGEAEETTAPQVNLIESTASEPAAAQEATQAMPEIETKAPGTPFEYDSGVKKWRRWWWIPLTVGIVIVGVSGLLMFLAYQASKLFWFGCLWVPLLFGVLVIGLAAASRTMRWLHVRIHQEPGERPQTIAISLPLPIRFIAWLVRIFRPHIPQMDQTNLDEVILALNKTSPKQPFYVIVDEGKSGEKVEVYIG